MVLVLAILGQFGTTSKLQYGWHLREVLLSLKTRLFCRMADLHYITPHERFFYKWSTVFHSFKINIGPLAGSHSLPLLLFKALEFSQHSDLAWIINSIIHRVLSVKGKTKPWLIWLLEYIKMYIKIPAYFHNKPTPT